MRLFLFILEKVTSLLCIHEYEDTLYAAGQMYETLAVGFENGMLLVQKKKIILHRHSDADMFEMIKEPYSVRLFSIYPTVVTLLKKIYYHYYYSCFVVYVSYVRTFLILKELKTCRRFSMTRFFPFCSYSLAKTFVIEKCFF